jgi:hypothetical protein
MNPMEARGKRLCLALVLALGIAQAGDGGLALAAEKPDARPGATDVRAGGADAVMLANRILDRWQAVAERLGLDSPTWREVFATQFGMMDASVLQGIDAVRVDTADAKASYAEFAQAVRSAVMQSYQLALAGKSPVKLGSTSIDQVFIPIVPCRIVDTRNVGGPISAGAARNFNFYANAAGFDWASQGGLA